MKTTKSNIPKKRALLLFCNLALGISLNVAQNASSDANPYISGTDCSAYGDQALDLNTTGTGNSALGRTALRSNTTGNYNTAAGYRALYSNTDNNNTAVGSRALMGNTSGEGNSAVGSDALTTNSTGDFNTAGGNSAGNSNITGNYNTAFGHAANFGGSSQVNQTAIGRGAITGGNNSIRLGNAGITQIQSWALTFTTSDMRFKFNLSGDEVKGIEFIKRLRPVVYNVNPIRQTEHTTQNFSAEKRKMYLAEDFSAAMAIRRSGFIAQEVEKAASETGYNFDAIHKPKNNWDMYSLCYDLFVVPLVKAIQEQQELLQKYKNRIQGQKQILTQLLGELNGRIESSERDYCEKGFSLDFNNTGRETKINYSLPTNSTNCNISIYDMTGRQEDVTLVDTL